MFIHIYLHNLFMYEYVPTYAHTSTSPLNAFGTILRYQDADYQ